MKISLALGPRRTLSRQSAWGCFTTNLALPGFGSLMAGRVSGYPQAALGLAGVALTTLFAARFFAWYLVNLSRMTGDQEDPFGTLVELWRAARWPLLGVSVFLAGWLWALVTSFQILSAARRDGAAQVPPRLE
ncbi:MAG TPA: hypothetical protein VJA21_02455 [Verrucomicrobiae bacterium]